MRSTYMAKPGEIERKWYIIDAAGKTLGKLSTETATILRGKHKPTYTPNVDCGDNVIVINASEVVLTGNKLDQKIYYTHSRFVGGLKSKTYRELLDKNPELAVEHAVRGMLPKTRLGRQMFKKLNVYRGSEHPHQAQKPENLG